MSIDLSVVICTYNRSMYLKKSLASLCRQTLNQRQLEVIVVDNNSTDDTPEVIDSYCGKFIYFQHLREIEQGLSFARNLGWEKSSGKYVAFLDDDAWADEGWCAGILQAFASSDQPVVCVGGQIYPDYEVPPPDWFSDEVEIRSWGDTAMFLPPEVGRYGFSGSNMAFPRKVLERYGGFDDHLGMKGDKIRLGEETQLFFRIFAEEPFFWYEPDLIVYHLVTGRNYLFKYRMQRSFEAGRARAIIERTLGGKTPFGRNLALLAFTLKELLKVLFNVRAGKFVRMKKTGEVVNQVAYLVS